MASPGSPEKASPALHGSSPAPQSHVYEAAEKAAKSAGTPKAIAVAAPSASVVVISPQNEILLLHRVGTGTFSLAHVFPGGNLSTFHEGTRIPAVESTARHVDGPAYRLAAIRETFEESGVLLARPAGQDASPRRDQTLLRVSGNACRRARLDVANNKIPFEEWLSSVGGVPDSENLIPFTRWVTPPNMPRRYTTQMYLYMLPLDDAGGSGEGETGSACGDDDAAHNNVSADLTEVMAAEFAPAATWVQRAQANEITLFPPQMYLLSLLAPLLQGRRGLPSGAAPTAERVHYAEERARVDELLRDGRAADEDDTTFVPWAERVISPRMVGKLPKEFDDDGRGVMLLDNPGPELKSSGRSGDAYRVVLIGNMPPGPPRNLEVRRRADVMPVLAKARAAMAKAATAEAKAGVKADMGVKL